MKIKRGDTVQVMKGKDRGKQGKVLQASHSQQQVIVEGLGKVKKHMRPKRSGSKGERIELEFPIHASKVMLVCPKCNKPTRVERVVLEDKTKHRRCKKCQAEISS